MPPGDAVRRCAGYSQDQTLPSLSGLGALLSAGARDIRLQVIPSGQATCNTSRRTLKRGRLGKGGAAGMII